MRQFVRNRSVGRALLSLLALLTFTLGCGSADPGAKAASASPPEPVAQSQAAPSAEALRQTRADFVALAKELQPSVVNIKVTKRQKGFARSLPGIPEEFFRDFLPGREMPNEREVSGQGSGVIISEDGYVLTNHHVVGGASEIEVTLWDQSESSAKLIGSDPKTDLALIKLDKTGLPAAALGDSGQTQVGEWVMAIGNPFGLDHTVTVGVLSGKGRVIGAGPYDDFLQTDASINPGNSGGPLFNLEGQVIGINTAIVAGGQGIGFAIPSNLAKEIFTQLRDEGKVTRGFIGAGIQNLDPKLRRALDLPEQVEGALVANVVEDGPAQRAGLQRGDVIIEFDGRSIASDRELLRAVAATQVGKQVGLVVQRGAEQKRLSLTVASRPDEQQLSEKEPAQDPARSLGLEVRELTPALARQLGVDRGVAIARVLPASPAQRAGLQSGDVILEAGGRQVDSVAALRKALSAGDDELALLVQRQGSSLFVVLEK